LQGRLRALHSAVRTTMSRFQSLLVIIVAIFPVLCKAATNSTAEEDECSSWVEFIPHTGTWNSGLKSGLYLVALLWCFLGVAIIADIFMEAIEAITSTKTKYKGADGEEYEAMVWNDTIANLTLMAFGSSAPEILLAVIETVTTLGGPPGKLGPSTIVGSAAFNLLVISAVCIMAIPQGETKKVDQFGVFMITASFSVFAYVWLLFCLGISTKDEVDMWEAVITFLFFPVLVFLAFGADQNWWGLCGGGGPAEGPASELTESNPMRNATKSSDTEDKDEVGIACNTIGITIGGHYFSAEELVKKQAVDAAKAKYGNEPTPAQIQKEWDALTGNNKQGYNLSYRSNAVRAFTGQRRLKPDMRMESEAAADAPKATFIGFKRDRRIVKETHQENNLKTGQPLEQGEFQILVLRSGNLSSKVQVKYRTEDVQGGNVSRKATHQGDKPDYVSTEGTLSFDANETEKWFKVKVLTDGEAEDDEDFNIILSTPEFQPSYEKQDGETVELEDKKKMVVTIMDVDSPGEIGFRLTDFEVSCDEDWATVNVTREGGSKGELEATVTVSELGKDKAQMGLNFTHDVMIGSFDGGEWKYAKEVMNEANDGQNDQQEYSFNLKFKDGELDKNIQIQLVKDSVHTAEGLPFQMSMRVSDDFKQKQNDGTIQFTGGVISKTRQEATISIQSGTTRRMMDNLAESARKIQENDDRAQRSDYAQQFRDAVEIHGDVDAAGNEVELTCMDYTLHCISLPWKLLFAIVPPVHWYNGKLAFGISLMMIGALTAIVGELATLFGCNAGLKAEVTAITFVALGTSLPDTFASAQAAAQSDNADAAIGNVTGSNAVNVFFGLGVPWLIACIYSLPGPYVFPAGALAFSVIVFIACAITCFGVLYAKRVFDGGELGGNSCISRAGSAFFCCSLWFVYVLLSSLLVYEHFENPFQ